MLKCFTYRQCTIKEEPFSLEEATQEELLFNTEMALPMDSLKVPEQAYVEQKKATNHLSGAHEVSIRAEIRPEFAQRSWIPESRVDTELLAKPVKPAPDVISKEPKIEPKPVEVKSEPVVIEENKSHTILHISQDHKKPLAVEKITLGNDEPERKVEPMKVEPMKVEPVRVEPVSVKVDVVKMEPMGKFASNSVTRLLLSLFSYQTSFFCHI